MMEDLERSRVEPCTHLAHPFFSAGGAVSGLDVACCWQWRKRAVQVVEMHRMMQTRYLVQLL